MRCLPYFLIIGCRKCGTTSLYHHLITHSQIIESQRKEIHWFTLRWIKDNKKFRNPINFTSYFKYFDKLSLKLERKPNLRTQLITGEASPSYIWRYFKLEKHLETLYKRTFKPYSYSIPNFIQETLPKVKILVILRNPIDR